MGVGAGLKLGVHQAEGRQGLETSGTIQCQVGVCGGRARVSLGLWGSWEGGRACLWCWGSAWVLGTPSV